MDHTETKTATHKSEAPTTTHTAVGTEVQPGTRRTPAPYRRPAFASGAGAIGALALGAMAVGALAIGRLAIGRLAIGRSRLRSLRVDELSVKRLEVGELLMTRAAGSRDEK